MSLFNDSTRSGNQPGYKTMSVGVRRLQEALNMHMDVQSKSQFVEALNQYHVSRDVPTFVRNLKQVLDTPAKKQLFGLIRKVIPKMDIEDFDRCVQFHGKKFDTMPAKRSKKPIQRSRSPLPGGGFNTTQPFKKQQKQKKVKESRRGKESDGKESDSSRSTKHTMTSKSSRSLKSAMKNKGPDIKKVHMKQSDDPQKGFGFSIRGGSEFGLGIYVSIVDKGGVAEKHGLNAGDLIMEANGVSCEKISHNEAATIIRSAKKLDLKLSRVGRIPGTFVVHQMYKWVDAHSRPVSPPPELEQLGQVDSLGRRSGFSLLKGADERKINVNVQRGQGLGLMIRGGREFGLGIYISGVDPFSVADDNGIKVGDQILDINGQSFLDITHAQAVKVLKYSTQMIMTIKDVGKLPYGRTKIDETHWVNNSAPPLRRKRNDSQNSDSTVTSSKGSVFRKGMGSQLMLNSTIHSKWDSIQNQASELLNETEQGTLRYYLSEYQRGYIFIYPFLKQYKGSVFRKGMGSQLMLNSTIHSKWDSIQNQASELLNETEQGTLRYYLSEYQRGYISVDGLLMASFELLNTKAKMTMMSEIKKWVRARDINKFNVLLQRREAQQNKLFRSSSVSLDGGRHGGFTRHRHRLSEGAIQSLPPSRSHSARERPGRLRRQASESELEPLRWAIEQIEDDPNFNSDLNDDLEPFQSLRLRSLSSESLSAPPNLHQTSLSSRRSLSVETLTPVYIDTTSDLPPSPRQRVNSSSSMQQKSRANSASQKHHGNDLTDDLEPFQSLRLRSLSSESLSAPPNLHQTSLSSRRSLSVETLTPVYIDTTSDLPPSPRQRVNSSSSMQQRSRDDLEPFQSLRLRSLSSESLSAPPNLHQTSLSSRRSLSVETLTPVYIDTTSDLPPSPRQRVNSSSSMQQRSRANSVSQNIMDDLEPFQSLRLRSLSSESLSAPPNLHQTSLSSRRSMSVETLTPVYIDTTSDLPPSPRQRVNSSSSMQQRSRANSASQKHRPREAFSHRQRSGSNNSTLRKRHKSLENLTTSRSPSPTFRRVKSPYPSRRNSHDNVRNTLSSVSYTHLQDFESEYDDSPIISRSLRLNQISNIVYADVHQPPRNGDGNPSDDSGVEVNGNHGNGQNRVTISADHPIDIDDVLERRTPFLPSSVSAPQSRNASITNRKNPYRSNNSTLTNQKPSTKPRRSVQNVFDNQNRLKLNGNGSVSSIRSDRKRPPVEIRINDGEGSIDTMSIETPSSPHFVNQSRNSFVHQSYARSKRNNQSGLRNRRSPASRYSDTDDDDGNDDDDDEPEMFDAHSEMGDNSDFYVSPLDRVLDREDYDAYSDRSSVISYNFEDQSVSLARQKYGDIPLEFIQVYKTKPTLGMAIEGGANTRQPLPRVINLQPGGSAYESGGLKVGHVILEVNGRPMRGLEHIAAAKVIAEAFKNKTRDIMELLVTNSSVK